jgi:hypothetical protein
MAEVDLRAIELEVAGLSREQLIAEFLPAQVKAKKAALKQREANRASQLKKKEVLKLMKARAEQLGLWEEIEAQATALAEKELEHERITKGEAQAQAEAAPVGVY